MRRLAPFSALILLASIPAAAQESELTLHSKVTGSREQPKVMYIVPWQQAAAREFEYELHNSIAEEMYTPIDRDEFVRGLVITTAHGNNRTDTTESNTD